MIKETETEEIEPAAPQTAIYILGERPEHTDEWWAPN